MGAGPPTSSGDPSGTLFIDKVRKKFIIKETTPTICNAKDREQLKNDASLRDDDCIEDVEKCVAIAFECVNLEPRNRPAAADICTRLNQVIPSDDQLHQISLQVNQLQM